MEILPTPLKQTDSTGVLARFLEDILVITRDQELGLHVDMEPFTFHASLPCLELGDTLLLGVRYEHQVISVEELPWYASAELMPPEPEWRAVG